MPAWIHAVLKAKRGILKLSLETLSVWTKLYTVHAFTHLCRGRGRCSAHRWPPGQCPPQCVWSGHLWAGRAEPHRRAWSHPQSPGGIWSPRGSWCRCDLPLSSSCGHTERRSDIIDSDSVGLLNKQNALGQKAQNCFCFINSLSRTAPEQRLTHTIAH